MPAARSLLALAPWPCLLVLALLSLNCVNVTPPWELAPQTGGSSGALPGAGSGGRAGFYGAGGARAQTTDPVGTLAGALGGSGSYDAREIGSDGLPSPRADSGTVIGGGNPAADTAAKGLDTNSTGGNSNSDGPVLSAGGIGGATAVATGGRGGTVSSMGGGAPADANNGSGGSGNDASSLSKCDGVVDSFICWRLGELGASCAATCAASGGTSPNASKHVGTAAQGGSQAECQRLFGLLGITNTVVQVSIDQGLGCHQKNGMPLPYAWASSPDYNDNASSADVHILCGCKR